MNAPLPTPPAAGRPSPLGLLLRIAMLSSWRRLLGLREQSWLLLTVIGTFLAGYLTLAFGLFYYGLRFIAKFPGLGGLLVERLLFVLFAFLFGLLLISNLVISYTNLFRNRETTFLLSLPLPLHTIFQWKLLESTLLASWAFIFLIAPLLFAYGMVNHVAWHFYPMVLGLLGLFIVLPGVGGAWAAITLARFLDRKVFQVLIVGALVAFIGMLIVQFRPQPVTDQELEARMLAVIDRLLENTRFANFPLLPSYWMSASVQQWSEGALGSAGFFALVMLSNALFFSVIACRGLGTAFYEAANRVNGRGGLLAGWAWKRGARSAALTRRADGSPAFPRDWIDGFLRIGGLLAPDTRALLAKDMRVFWRDTAQWAQTAMLFGLLGVYIINLRHFTRQLDSPFWLSLVSFLNMGACALNLATLTTRFVFPQFSLEGRRVWLVGLAPVGLVRVVLLKFWLASAATLVITLGLVVLSCTMLGLPPSHTLFFGLSVTVMTFTLNAVAVGLGALYPNLRETNPSKIVSGFGGTFCLVLSFVYILVSVVLLAVSSPWGWKPDMTDQFAPARAASTWLAFVLVSVLAGWLPLRLGLRKVARAEL